MKPKELIGQDYVSGYARTNKIFSSYAYVDCVIAYITNPIGTMLIIKSKRKHFAFVKMDYCPSWQDTMLISVHKAFKVINDSKNKKVVDKALWVVLRDTMLLEAI